MALIDNKTALKSVRQRNYLARDFDGFRTVLLDYARQYYPDRIQDFSESSMGGLFLDMAAYIGDNMSFYLDHLYGELNSETVTETANIERTLRSAGVPITGTSSSVVYVDFYVEVPVLNDGSYQPNPELLPTIQSGTRVKSLSGIEFTLTENVDFWTINTETGRVEVNPLVEAVNGRRIGNTIVSKILRHQGLCTSGIEVTETFSLGTFTSFRRIPLSQPNVTQILSVIDGLGNIYYEVENLTHDVVYKNVTNTSHKNSLVKDTLKLIPAPYRFMKEVSLSSRKTTLVMGGGTADTLEDGIIPDPSEFSIPLPFSQTFSRMPVNPKKLLQTSTLGVCGSNTTLSVTYRYGGGLDHNVAPNSIKNITTLLVNFPENPSAGQQSQVKNTIVAINNLEASGGEDAPTADELLALMPTVKHSQERIVTKEDLLARVYTMPSNFGRVFRAAVGDNPSNHLAARLYIISRDESNTLITSPDALKINLKRYLNTYRMISDAIDVMDASIINLELNFQVVIDPSLNKGTILQAIIGDLKEQFDIKNFQIGQPIVISDVVSTIFARNGVIAVDSVKFKNLTGTLKNRSYSPISFDVDTYTKNQIIYPLQGSIFEIKYPDVNIIGKAVSNV